jgi:hypothetical protein
VQGGVLGAGDLLAVAVAGQDLDEGDPAAAPEEPGLGAELVVDDRPLVVGALRDEGESLVVLEHREHGGAGGHLGQRGDHAAVDDADDVVVLAPGVHLEGR